METAEVQPETPHDDKDIAVFVLHDHKVHTIKSETIDVPRCTWGKEMKILTLLKDIVKAVVDSGVLSGEATDAQAVALITQTLFDKGPEQLTQAVSILLDKPRQWVEDNLESEEMISLVVPFLYGKRLSMTKALGNYGKSLVQGLQNS